MPGDALAPALYALGQHAALVAITYFLCKLNRALVVVQGNLHVKTCPNRQAAMV